MKTRPVTMKDLRRTKIRHTPHYKVEAREDPYMGLYFVLGRSYVTYDPEGNHTKTTIGPIENYAHEIIDDPNYIKNHPDWISKSTFYRRRRKLQRMPEAIGGFSQEEMELAASIMEDMS